MASVPDSAFLKSPVKTWCQEIYLSAEFSQNRGVLGCDHDSLLSGSMNRESLKVKTFFPEDALQEKRYSPGISDAMVMYCFAEPVFITVKVVSITRLPLRSEKLQMSFTCEETGISEGNERANWIVPGRGDLYGHE